jgi:predicted metal-dependent hydrolase
MARPGASVREVPGPPLDGLPSYIVRFNPSARRLRISVSPRRGVMVTVPPSANLDAAVSFLVAKRSWVQRAVARLDEREAHRASAGGQLPDEIVFPAVGERWAVRYRTTSSATVRVLRNGSAGGSETGSLVVSGNVADRAACLRALNRFVDARARELLPAELAALAEAHDLHPASVSIRHQRTRWGSCSTAGAISLNRTLLFLTRELAVAIMLHELVHLARHDHSDSFWTALEKVDPEARAHRRQMREAWRFVPPWAEAPHPRNNGDT